MKKLLVYLLAFVAVISLWSCDDSTEGPTWITYYPTIEILGDTEVTVNVGETYVDEGCHAEINGEDVSDQVIVTSDVDYSTPGIYSISYTVYNEDGISTTVSRTVHVVDPNS